MHPNPPESRFGGTLAALAERASGDPAEPDARILARIRANVLDVLRRMHELHHAAAWQGRGDPDRLGLDPRLPPAERVTAAWERFVERLRAEWSERLAADERYGRELEARKGRVQLAALEEALAAWRRHLRDQEADDVRPR